MAQKKQPQTKRYAVAIALVVSAILPLVQARGHRVSLFPNSPWFYLMLLKKSNAEAVRFLKDVGAWADIQKVIGSVKVRVGKGKLRNRR